MRLILVLILAMLATAPSRAAERLVFFTGEFPPFAYRDSLTRMGGPFVEIVNGWCQVQHKRCSLLDKNWKQAQSEAYRGADVFGMFPMGKNVDRETWLHFSPPILTSGYGYFVFDTNNLVYKHKDNLAGYEIIAFGPSNTSHFATKIAAETPGMTLKIVPDMASVVREMRNPNAYDPERTAFYGNKDIIGWKLRQFGGGPVRFAGLERELNYYIGFPKKSADIVLVDSFRTYVEDMHKSGRLNTLLSEWDILAPPLSDAGKRVQ